MYNNNSYFGGNQFSNGYMPYNNYNLYQRQPIQQPTQQPIQQPTQNFPFSIVRFGTLDEIKGQLVSPSSAIMFIKNDLSEMYIKSADAMGNSAIETFKCSRVNDNTNLDVTPALDTKDFVKKEDLKDFITANDIKEFPTKQDMEDFNNKISSIEDNIKKLNRLSELIGGKSEGKQKDKQVNHE